MFVRSTLALAIIAALCLPGCDKLGGTSSKKSDSKAEESESGDSSDSSDETGSKSKKKKKKKKGDDTEASAKPTADPTPPPAPTPTETVAPSAPPATGDVKRYPEEVADSGRLGISNAVAARKEADTRSETIVTLQPGNEVQRVARLGAYMLVSWKSRDGDKFGWIEYARALKPGTVLEQPTARPASTEFDDVRFPRDGGTTTPKVDAAVPTATTPKTAPTVPAKTDAF